MKNLATQISGAICAIILVSACSSSTDANEENLSKAISSAFDKSGEQCFSFLPVAITLSDSDDSELAKANRAMVAAGLLSATATTDTGHHPMHTFDLSAKGRSILRDGQFCFGKAELDKLVKWEPVRKVEGLDAETAYVYYTYKIVEVPAWAQNTDLRAAEPAMREVFDGANRHIVMRAPATRMGTTWQLDKFGVAVSS
jgi:hypothetical protein